MFLGTNQVLQGKVVSGRFTIVRIDTSPPGVLELRNASQGLDEVDSNRRYAQLDKGFGLGEVLFGEAQIGTAKEVTDRVQYPSCVLWLGVDEDVQVFGRSGTDVEGDGMGSDDEVSSPIFVQ
jgi:hypothetical protein